MTALSLDASAYLLLLIAYFLGSIPFGLVLTKIFAQVNIQEIGSGNIGATNVLRTGHKGLAFATLVLDASKGAIAVVLAAALAFENLAAFAGLMAVIGHCFPVWLKFKGGKGVATGMACLATISWPLGLACALIWLGMAAIFRFSSLSAIAAFSICAIFAWFEVLVPIAHFDALAISCVTGLILVKHHANIKRLCTGTESKISFSK